IQFHPQYKLNKKDKVELAALPVIEEKTRKLIPYELKLNILYEDKDFLAINKPTGLISHPAPGHNKKTLANAVKFYLNSKNEDNLGDERAGLIHRLDGPTSGVILFAKSPQGLWFASKQFANREVEKEYLALVRGEVESEFDIDMPIGRDRINRKKYSPRTSKPRVAFTKIEPIASSGNATLVLARPKTGRTHQIRVHLAESNHPIIGDGIYGKIRAKRLMLHAFRLTIAIDPKKPEIKKTFTASLDNTFLEVLKSYKIGTEWQRKLANKKN
ncbi:MAG: RluA family pseudouridine synthase, partial [Candidatus Dojkabacteria bacterium]